MASEQHKHLAGIIKETHNRLRDDCRIYGPNEAWNRHIARKNDLKNYAVSMQQLATVHWNNPQLNSNLNTNCRILWIKNQCYEYFINGGMVKFFDREYDIAENNNIQLDLSNSLLMNKFVKLTDKSFNSNIKGAKINLLDVGSCYNPFGHCDIFHVTAIDLAPYCHHVLKCDFLNVNVGCETIISNDKRAILQLGHDSYDVCVFSLLLEYFPCPEQRFLCCEKAYKLLKNHGILIIITPDSRHANANAKIMKSWRYVLSKLGFMRINYEKLRHIHCICYRKCISKDVAVRWTKLQNFPLNDILFSSTTKIFIPQDIQIDKIIHEKFNSIDCDPKELVDGFNELPQLIQ